MLWIWKPSVGLTVEVSSFLIFLTIVVFPALSRPLDVTVSEAMFEAILSKHFMTCTQSKQVWARKPYTMRMRISFACRLCLRMIVSNPILRHMSYFAIEAAGRNQVSVKASIERGNLAARHSSKQTWIISHWPWLLVTVITWWRCDHAFGLAHYPSSLVYCREWSLDFHVVKRAWQGGDTSLHLSHE